MYNKNNKRLEHHAFESFYLLFFGSIISTVFKPSYMFYVKEITAISKDIKIFRMKKTISLKMVFSKYV